jgi:hypothetical protein
MKDKSSGIASAEAQQRPSPPNSFVFPKPSSTIVVILTIEIVIIVATVVSAILILTSGL